MIIVKPNTMEESKLQAIADSLSKHSGRKGLGTCSGAYSWSKTATSSTSPAGTDGLPKNALYLHFVKEGTYDPTQKLNMNHGDGRAIKRDFSDIPLIVDDASADVASSKKSKKLSKEERKAIKKAAKLEAKKKAKLEEKRRLKKMEKKGKRSSVNAGDAS